ncbi:MAG TPA: DUF5723 family protein [Flavitalea sp.]|nr:DUF5723 family protein [Flavitalea sp.]
MSAHLIHAQNYNAIHGSDYSGALGVYNNPSSIISSPYNWDITVVGFQFQTISNVIKGPNFPFSFFPGATFYVANGNLKRYADITADLHLLNGRFKLNDNSAFAFGMNVRQNTQAKTSPVNYTDSVKGPRSFLFLNEQNGTIDLTVAQSAWLEFYGAYATTIHDNETGKLNVGATLKLSRGISGAFANAKNVGVVSEQDNDQKVYKITNGDIKYGYSANLGDGESFSAADLFSNNKIGFGIDLGAEYLIKSPTNAATYAEQNTSEYDWKVGFSLLDLGWNSYEYSSVSHHASSIKSDVSSFVLQEKFSRVTSVNSFNDSVATVVNNFTSLTGNFKVMNPARAVINIDRPVSGNVFINGELSLNLAPGGANSYVLKETKFLTVTPRWETRKLGFFMPVQVNRHGNFWIGAALKAGPLLLGTHNLLNTFSKNKFLGSGAYLAFTIRPFEMQSRDRRSRQYECPTY